MKDRLLILVSGSVLALTACNKHEAAPNASNEANLAAENAARNAAENAAAVAGPLTTQGFANTAAASDKFEIESSRLAASAGASAAVKKFAEKMISAHTDSTAKLKSTLSGMNPPVTPDDTLTAEQQQKLDNLKSLKGAQFDSAYAAAQVEAHQAALDALKNYSASGDNAALKAFADGLIPTVTAHLNMAKSLK
jgi:putative membrane protein